MPCSENGVLVGWSRTAYSFLHEINDRSQFLQEDGFCNVHELFSKSLINKGNPNM